MRIHVPEKLLPIFTSDRRYISLDGGRGSAKSWSVAELLLSKGVERRRRVLCTREIQDTIRDSVHKLLSDRIYDMGLDGFYDIKRDSIIGANGTEFIFKGLYRNTQDIKSTEGIDMCWVEEAQSVSRASLRTLIPTIRKPGSQIIFTFNAVNETDPVYVDFKLTDRDDVLKITINYDQNPFFPDVLRREMEWDRAHDMDKYLHVWCGHCLRSSNEQVFYQKWGIKRFEAPPDTFFYFGADWGFSQDPAVLLRCFIIGTELFIDYEFYEIGVDIDYLPGRFELVPESKNYPCTADNNRPETIKYLFKNGYEKIKPTKKGKGSIEDGIAFLRSFSKIWVHERCKHTIDEMRLYKYKTDKLTGLISRKIADKDNHCIDALRYAIEDIMIKHSDGVFKFFEQQAQQMEGKKIQAPDVILPPVGSVKELTKAEQEEIERLQSIDAQSFLNNLKRY